MGERGSPTRKHSTKEGGGRKQGQWRKVLILEQRAADMGPHFDSRPTGVSWRVGDKGYVCELKDLCHYELHTEGPGSFSVQRPHCGTSSHSSRNTKTEQISITYTGGCRDTSWVLGTAGVVTQLAHISGDWPRPWHTLRHTCRQEAADMEMRLFRAQWS